MQAFGQIAHRQRATPVAGVAAGRVAARQQGAQAGKNVADAALLLAVELAVRGQVQSVDDPVEHGARRQHADLVLDDRQRGVVGQARLHEVAVGELEVARIDQQFGEGLVFPGRRQCDGNTDHCADQRRRGDQLPGSADAGDNADRIDQGTPMRIVGRTGSRLEIAFLGLGTADLGPLASGGGSSSFTTGAGSPRAGCTGVVVARASTNCRGRSAANSFSACASGCSIFSRGERRSRKPQRDFLGSTAGSGPTGGCAAGSGL